MTCARYVHARRIRAERPFSLPFRPWRCTEERKRIFATEDAEDKGRGREEFLNRIYGIARIGRGRR